MHLWNTCPARVIRGQSQDRKVINTDVITKCFTQERNMDYAMCIDKKLKSTDRQTDLRQQGQGFHKRTFADTGKLPVIFNAGADLQYLCFNTKSKWCEICNLSTIYRLILFNKWLTFYICNVKVTSTWLNLSQQFVL